MQIHASCVARAGSAVLLIGSAGSGKSDLALRLLGEGFTLVADDQVTILGQVARAPAPLAGLLEVRGLGIVRLEFTPSARLRLIARMMPDGPLDRLPAPCEDLDFGLPVVVVDPWQISAARKVSLALACAIGEVSQIVGSFML